MPINLPFNIDLSSPEAQADYISDALVTGDPLLVSHAFKEIGAARRIPIALADNPALGELMRAIGALGLRLTVTPA